MGMLSIHLPPFAGDYSGACSALFDFRCLIVLCDAGCCTKNYIDYDEPRWNRTKTTTLCAQLRTLEVTLGDDRRLLSQTAQAAREQQPDFVVLLGSPVPAIVGMDLPGMARELEQQTGIPAIGLETTGFSTYQRGIELAQRALLRRFGRKGISKKLRGVNLLGLTPLDLGAEGNDEALRQAVEQAGFSVVYSGSMGCDLKQLRQAPKAAVNLAVSAAGLTLARELEREWGIPYAARLPLGTGESAKLAPLLERAAATGESQIELPASEEKSENGILLVGDQVLTHSLRLTLRERGCTRPIAAGSFFSADPGLMCPGDLRLTGEGDLIRTLRSGRFTTVVGDPLLLRIPEVRDLTLIPLPHPAVSGRLHWKEVPTLTGGEMDELLDKIYS